MKDGVGLAVCAHLVREAQAVVRQQGWDDVVVVPWEPHCDHPWPTWDAWRDALPPEAAGCASLVVLGGACLPVASPPAGSSPAVVQRASQCFGLLTSLPLVEEWEAAGRYVVAPGWVRRWRSVVQRWGFDMVTAREHFHEFARMLLLLDTGVDGAVQEHLEEVAAFFNLPWERRMVGLDMFSAQASAAVAEARLRLQRAEHHCAMQQLQRQVSESALLVDFSARIMALGGETDVLIRLLEALAELLPAHQAVVASVSHQRLRAAVARPESADTAGLPEVLEQSQAFRLEPERAGFSMQLKDGAHVVGLLRVRDLALPQHLEHYANLVLTLATVCGPALVRARALVGFLPICARCKKIRDSNGAWRPVELYVREHSEAEFTHGICPECMDVLYPDEA